jgi:PAS domain S-box-containing protein
MSLTRKTILVIVGTFLLLIVILAVTSDIILRNSFALLEKRQLAESVARIGYLFDDLLDDLDSSANDYASLLNRHGIRELGAVDIGSLVNHHADFIAWFDLAGKTLSVRAADYHLARLEPPDEDLLRSLRQALAFSVAHGDRPLRGAIRSGGRLHMLVGKRCGNRTILLTGRHIDREEIARISRARGFPVEIGMVGDPRAPDDFKEASAALERGAPFYAGPPDASRIAGYALYRDLYGRPLFLVKLTEQRLLFAQGTATVMTLMAFLLVAGCVFCGVMLIFIRNTVLRRLAALQADVRQIGRENGISFRLGLTQYGDELDELAGAINATLDSLESAEKALKESEQRYRVLFERAPESLFLLGLEGDGQGRIVAANRAAAEQHGYTVEELLQMNIRDICAPESISAAAGIMARIGAGEWVTFEVHHQRRDGTYFPIEVHAGPVLLDGTTYILGFDRDITVRKQAEEADRAHMEQIKLLNGQLTRHAAELALANHELESFNYSVSHDLRGPLTRISGYCQLLLEDEPELPLRAREYVSRVYTSSCWLNEMIDTMLSLGRLSRSELVLNQVDLSALASTLAGELMPEGTHEVVIAPGVMVMGDERLLRILMANLLDNARKYTAGTEAPRIEFGLLPDAPEQVCFVRDNGVGFAMQDKDRLFRVFTRLHSAEEFPGNGIGLATVQRIIALHGGRIWAEGVPRQGATFYFTLPSEEIPSVRTAP